MVACTVLFTYCIALMVWQVLASRIPAGNMGYACPTLQAFPTTQLRSIDKILAGFARPHFATSRQVSTDSIVISRAFILDLSIQSLGTVQRLGLP